LADCPVRKWRNTSFEINCQSLGFEHHAAFSVLRWACPSTPSSLAPYRSRNSSSGQCGRLGGHSGIGPSGAGAFGMAAYANVPTRPTNSSNALSERFIWIFIALSPVAWDLLTMSWFKHAFGQTLPGFAGWLGKDRKKLIHKEITLSYCFSHVKMFRQIRGRNLTDRLGGLTTL